jgi:hypothetical protein
MRFSLLTLLLVKLWIGLAVLVWLRREAWIVVPLDRKNEYAVSASDGSSEPLRFQTPDGSRFIKSFEREKIIKHYLETKEAVIWDTRTKKPLYVWSGIGLQHEGIFSKLPVHFIDDDHLCVQWGNLDSSCLFVLERRFPEWWWGHFYRAEVWGLMILSGVLVWRFWRRRTGAGPEHG